MSYSELTLTDTFRPGTPQSLFKPEGVVPPDVRSSEHAGRFSAN